VINVLVVDDSTVMVRLLSEIIQRDPELRVVGTASHGIEAVRKVEALAPQVVTMDVQMPRMDGLKAVEYIMSTVPTPIIMISSLTQEGAEATIHALDLGAIDFVPKPSGYVSLDIENLASEIIAKIKLAAKIRVVRTVNRVVQIPIDLKATEKKISPPQTPITQSASSAKKKITSKKVVAIGCSTGGPTALNEILQRLPHDFPAPVLVVQHMPEKFTEKLAELLNHRVAMEVVEGKEGMDLQQGMVYIAPGGHHMRVRPNRTLALQPEKSPQVPCPSVDILMTSVADVFGKEAVGVILTGMGNDGLMGMNAIKDKKGVTIAQDEETSLVFGMPKVAIESGCIDSIVPLSLVPDEILHALRDQHD
jgi:two-component system, chemotaxis family, protein-glutamate methylesterase/glutaminase